MDGSQIRVDGREMIAVKFGSVVHRGPACPVRGRCTTIREIPAFLLVNSALVCFFPLTINTIVGLRSADEDRISLMRSLAATPMQIFAMLRVPKALPYIFAGLEIAMIFALIGAIVGEFVGAQAGIWMLIQSMNFTMDVAGQFSILLIPRW